MYKKFRRILFVVVAGLFVVALAPGAGAAKGEGSRGKPSVEMASYNGAVVSMDVVWDSAQACLVWPEMLESPECFDSEEEMDRRVESLEQQSGSLVQSDGLNGGVVMYSASSCSSYLRLYDGTSYTGSALYLRTRAQWFNLSSLGFDQRTSSFKIGACSAYFADYSNGGGSWYPTSATQAYDVATSMISGWNNDVSSVYIT